MLISMLKWFRGYLYLSIQGYATERFLNLCKNHNILIWNLYRESEECFLFCMSVKSFRKLLPIVYKTKAHIRIERRCGLPFYLYRYRKRKILLLCGLLFASCIYYLSGFLWDIQVSGQSGHTETEIVGYLEEQNVRLGTKVNEINCLALEEKIREDYKDVGWVSAEIKGTRLLIRIHETVMPSYAEEATEHCHRIAAHDGVIHSIVTAKGVAMVKKGDTVKRGDILIQGIVEIKDDSDTVVKKKPVIATGTIQLDTQIPYREVLSMNYEEKLYTGKTATEYGIRFGGKKIFLMNPLKKIESLKKYDIMTKESIVKLTKNIYLPIRIEKRIGKQFQTHSRQYTKQKARGLLTSQFEQYVKELTLQGIQVLGHDVKVSYGTGESVAAGKIQIREPQTLYQRIREEEWKVVEENESNGEES